MDDSGGLRAVSQPENYGNTDNFAVIFKDSFLILKER